MPDVSTSWGLGERGKGSQHQPEVLAFLGFLSDILGNLWAYGFLLLPPLGGNVGMRCSCPRGQAQFLMTSLSSRVVESKKAVQRLEEQLMKLEVQATDREENKQIALGTSKLNYLDPRITVAW